MGTGRSVPSVVTPVFWLQVGVVLVGRLWGFLVEWFLNVVVRGPYWADFLDIVAVSFDWVGADFFSACRISWALFEGCQFGFFRWVISVRNGVDFVNR